MTKEERRSHIARHALERFITEGYSRVRTDDLAADLGISKKTIYRVFTDKKELLREAVRIYLDRVEGDLVENFDRFEGGFPEQITTLFGIVQRYIVPIQAVFVADLRRSTPDIWRQIDDFRTERVFSRMVKTLHRGITDGYLRTEIRPDILVGLLFQFIQHVVNPRTIMELDTSFAELFGFFRMMVFEGILTESGRVVWEAFDETK